MLINQSAVRSSKNLSLYSTAKNWQWWRCLYWLL